MEDKVAGFSGNGDNFNAEVAAQRLLLAALAGGFIKTAGFTTDAAGAKELGEFLGAAAVTLAKRLRADTAK